MADTARGRELWENIEDAEERGNALQATFDQVLDEQGSYRQETLRHMRLYRNLNSLAYISPSGGVAGLSSPLSLNVIRSMTNNVHSRITKHRVKVTMQTAGASFEMREKAKALDAYGLGLTLKEQLHKQTPMAFLDCVVTGTGIMKTFADKARKRVRFERKFSPHVVVDIAEGAYLCPAHFYEIDYIDRGLLMKRYSRDVDVEALKAAPPAESSNDEFYMFTSSPSSDRVQVITGYYFNPDDEFEGFKSVIVDGHELEGGKVKSGNPFSVMRWSTSNLGWYGMGLPEELKGIQLEINRLVRKIQTSFGLLANPYIFADRASAIARGQFTDIPGSVILFNGKPPIVQAPQTVHPEVFAHLDRLYQRAFEISRMSQLAVPSAKRQYESGRAKLIDEDSESDSFASVHREWDELHVDVIRKGIRAATTIPNYKVQVWGEETYEEIDFKKDIDLEEDEWTIRPMPTAFLGETPAAQIDNAERLAKSGLITRPEEILEQVTSPDIAAYVKRVTAPKRIVEKIVGHMLRGGDYIGPEPEMNLALALDIANGMYVEHLLIDGFPKERLQNVREFMLRVKDLIKTAAGTNNVPTMGATATPGGAPPIPGGAPLPPAPAAPPMAAPVAA